jgi:hypothetical protein
MRSPYRSFKYEQLERRSYLALTAPVKSSAVMAFDHVAQGQQTVEAKVDWNDISGASQYVVQKSDDGTNWAQLGDPFLVSLAYDPLGAGQDRFYRVKAQQLNGSGQVIDESSYSAAVSPDTDRDESVQVSASVSSNQISISWPDSSTIHTYSVFRNTRASRTWTTLVNNASHTTGAQVYTDTTTSTGSEYEYRVQLTTTLGTFNGYVYAGRSAPMIDGRGKVLVLVDSTQATALSSRLAQLKSDLIGDGWTVEMQTDVPRDNDSTSSRPNVVGTKERIQDAYDSGALKAVILVGHVPVPYSGSVPADGHIEHSGAWASDLYYADVVEEGTWTDSSVNTTGPSRPQNDNVPSDGKFDQDYIPKTNPSTGQNYSSQYGVAEVAIGRIDMANLDEIYSTRFPTLTSAEAETELLKQYLDKDHSFRFKLSGYVPDREALIDDNRSQGYARVGWRNFAPLVGATEITNDQYGNVASSTNGYLLSYAVGGVDNQYTVLADSASTYLYGLFAHKSAFNLLLGSYSGDWDSNSNVLRGSLATAGLSLATGWGNLPSWYIHHMGLGEHIGSSLIETANSFDGVNTRVYGDFDEPAYRHLALLGEPTLRLHPVAPISNLEQYRPFLHPEDVRLDWDASSDSNIIGYHVYRASAADGPYTRLTTNPTSALSYYDSTAGGYTRFYMVRAVKLESTPSGTYKNPSQGMFIQSDPLEGEEGEGGEGFGNLLGGGEGGGSSMMSFSSGGMGSVSSMPTLVRVFDELFGSSFTSAPTSLLSGSGSGNDWRGAAVEMDFTGTDDEAGARVSVYLQDEEGLGVGRLVQVQNAAGETIAWRALSGSMGQSGRTVWFDGIRGAFTVRVTSLDGGDVAVHGVETAAAASLES